MSLQDRLGSGKTDLSRYDYMDMLDDIANWAGKMTVSAEILMLADLYALVIVERFPYPCKHS